MGILIKDIFFYYNLCIILEFASNLEERATVCGGWGRGVQNFVTSFILQWKPLDVITGYFYQPHNFKVSFNEDY